MGSLPYGHVVAEHDVGKQVCNGEQLDEPVNCPNVLYEIMKQCWRWNAKVLHPFRANLSVSFSSPNNNLL